MKFEQKFSNREVAPTGALGMRSRLTDIGREKHPATRQRVASLDRICHPSSDIKLEQTSPGRAGRGLILGFKISRKCATGPMAARSGQFCGRKAALVKTLDMYSLRTDILSPPMRQRVCRKATLRTQVRHTTIALCIHANGH
ncbi:MAG TPA: hypothetical protein VNN22_15255 [Verrucomicrobiae bacterium]|nr:hypothetical protein [Verrucomicrobiae bacterium]